MEKGNTKAKNNGEIKARYGREKPPHCSVRVFLGMSYEQSFLNGLDVEELKEQI